MAELIGLVIFSLIVVIPGWRIFKQTGMAPAWSLLLFIPTLGFLVVIAILAFGRWPAIDGPERPSQANEDS